MGRTEKELTILWQNYSRTHSASLREQIIIEYAPLVKIVSSRLKLGFSDLVEFDDLCSMGLIGLIDAIDKFDLEKDVKFETYASLRIRGAILDELRKQDWIPRTLRQRKKQIEKAKTDLVARGVLTPSDEEVAKQIGISVEEFNSWLIDLQISETVDSLDALVGVKHNENNPNHTDVGLLNTFVQRTYAEPGHNIEIEELKENLANALTHLTDMERKVITLIYYDDLTSVEVSEILDVSESRVSQIHGKARQKMKSYIGDYMYLFTL